MSTLPGRDVALSRTPPRHGAVLERALPECEGGIPDGMRGSASAHATGATITSGHVAPGTFFDFGTIHLLTTSALARLPSRTPHR
ncbi:hypothetical protein ABZ934_23010 [Streptomyces sp. NPDC046557]|uniref:hypothetical protein n=1 Tax=Streptomyces sp. NPDC046557 TaxID=3155372 RepID=UPI0033F450E4